MITIKIILVVFAFVGILYGIYTTFDIYRINEDVSDLSDEIEATDKNVDELEKTVADLRTRVAKIENPAKYAVGDRYKLWIVTEVEFSHNPPFCYCKGETNTLYHTNWRYYCVHTKTGEKKTFYGSIEDFAK